jgi:Rho-binding antiterminator
MITLEKYIPINCDFYDELESLATIGKRVKVSYMENSARIDTSGIVKNLFTKDSVEYMTLDSGITFRLDKLVEIDGKIPPNVC